MRRVVVLFGVVCIFCTLLLCGCTAVKTEVNSGSDDVTAIPHENTYVSQHDVESTTKTKTTHIEQTTSPSASTTVDDGHEEMITEFFDDPTPVETRAPNPHITMYLEKDVYEPDEVVYFHIVDPTNTGFLSDKSLTLWEWNGEEWVKARRVSQRYLPRAYKEDPRPDGGPIDVVDSIYLSAYEDVQHGKRYKITLGIAGRLLEAEFTIASE